jgi:hypothetical protein
VRRLRLVPWLVAVSCLAGRGPAAAQPVTYRGFVEAQGFVFPQDTATDSRNVVLDVLGRGEVFVRPVPWLQLAAGVDLRANSHDQVSDSWRPDIADRGRLRPRVSIRRLAATIHRGPLTLDVGKQFIRWGKTDIVTPTDRFAPRDFLNVIDNEFLAVPGARAVVALGSNALDAVWVPFFTPSRLPLFDQRWGVATGGVELELGGNGQVLPHGSQAGLRWEHSGGRYEYSLSFFDGFNNLPILEPLLPPLLPPAGLPAIDIIERFPSLRMYGGDAAVPTRWFTAKGEAAYFTSSNPASDEYVLYVLQLERQTGEWLFVGGYAGEVVTARRAALSFAPDRGTSRSIVGRAAYTIDTNRSVALDGAVRQNGRGLYVKGEYSQARGEHWRVTASGVLIRGEPGDFLGQYRLNSHIALALRYSF